MSPTRRRRRYQVTGAWGADVTSGSRHGNGRMGCGLRRECDSQPLTPRTIAERKAACVGTHLRSNQLENRRLSVDCRNGGESLKCRTLPRLDPSPSQET